MARSKLLVSLLVVVGVCMLAATSFAKTKCGFNGDYSFFFWNPDDEVTGTGYFTVAVTSASKCRSGVVVAGGIIDCTVSGTEYESFIEDGSVFLETDGEGTMEIETNGDVCDYYEAIELDISVVSGGKKVLFSSNGAEYVSSGTVENTGYEETITGRAEKCYAGDISGSYDIRFWEPDSDVVGDCTIEVGGGYVLGGTCRCNNDGTEYLSEIEGGGYTLGEDCESSAGFMEIVTSSDELCDYAGPYYLDFAVAEAGSEIMGQCDQDNPFSCSFEGWLQ